MTELGRLGIIDFNMALVNGSYTCRGEHGEYVATRGPKNRARQALANRKGDADALTALDVLHNRSCRPLHEGQANS